MSRLFYRVFFSIHNVSFFKRGGSCLNFGVHVTVKYLTQFTLNCINDQLV